MRETKEELIKDIIGEISDLQCTVSEYDNVLVDLERQINGLALAMRAAKDMREDMDKTMVGFVDLLRKILGESF